MRTIILQIDCKTARAEDDLYEWLESEGYHYQNRGTR